MKKIISLIIALGFVLMLCINALAVDESRKYFFDLEANGRTEIEADPGDVITLILHLKRVDSDENASMYAMQDEIYYDDNFFDIVPESSMTGNGINVSDLSVGNGYMAHYMNFVSFSGGEDWKADTNIGTFQLKVTGTHGVSTIENKNFLVSTQDGLDTFIADASDVLVIVTRECVVHFETNGGTPVEDQVVELYSKLKKPDCTKEGYHIEGWYKDKDFSEKWDFKNDMVNGNITLFAKWAEGSGSNLSLILLIVALVAGLAYYILRKKKKESDEPSLSLKEKMKKNIGLLAKAEADFIDGIFFKNKNKEDVSDNKSGDITEEETSKDVICKEETDSTETKNVIVKKSKSLDSDKKISQDKKETEKSENAELHEIGKNKVKIKKRRKKE